MQSQKFFNIKKNMVYNIHGNFINDKFITRDMFMSKIDLDDRLMVKTMLKNSTVMSRLEKEIGK